MTSLEAGDIVWIDLDPVLGTEQAGRRPALVLTTRGYHENSRRAVVCPITSNPTPWPTKCLLPPGLKTKGYVLVDQVRAVERDLRGFRFIERAPPETLAEVRGVLGALLQIA